jgi:serine/threonine protein kinase
MEYASGGNLRHFLDRQDEVDDTGLAIIVCGIVEGMKYLHMQGIVHRDLRPENIFLNRSGFPKIGGFEKARLLSVDLTLTCDDNCSLYLAPELYGRPVLARNTPLVKLHSLASGSERPGFPPDMNFILKQIIQECWSSDSVMRNSFDVI